MNSSQAEESISTNNGPAHLFAEEHNNGTIKMKRGSSISVGEQDAAIALLMVQGEFQNAENILNSMGSSSTSTIQQRSAKKLPIKKRLLQDAFKEDFSSPMTTKKTSQEQPGITFDKICENDVLCGGSGEGILLSSKRPGNIKFKLFIGSKLKEFMSSKDKFSKFQLAKLAVSSVNDEVIRGRFLVMNKMTGLWYEVRQEKAWSKAIRTFIALAQQVMRERQSQKFQLQQEGKPNVMTMIQNGGRVAVPTKLINLGQMKKHVPKVYKPVEQPTLVIPKVIPTRLSNITSARRA